MIISIDPSINNCGYAIFIDNILVKYGVIEPDKCAKTWQDKAISVVLKIKVLELSMKETIKCLVYEMPDVWYSAKGQVAKDSGALEKLYFIAGMIHGRYLYFAYPVSVMSWKGQLPKEVTLNTIKKKYHLTDSIYTHEADAIAIGDYYISTIKGAEDALSNMYTNKHWM